MTSFVFGILNSSLGAEFLPTLKPLHCHEVQVTAVRSTVECAVQCKRDLDSCVGYALSTTESSNIICEICYIYDLGARIASQPTWSQNTLHLMPIFRLQNGKISQTFVRF